MAEGTPPYFPVNTYPHQVLFPGTSQPTLRQTGPQTLVVQVITRSDRQWQARPFQVAFCATTQWGTATFRWIFPLGKTIWRSLQIVVKNSRFDLYLTRRDDRQVKFSRIPYKVSALTTSQKFIIDHNDLTPSQLHQATNNV